MPIGLKSFKINSKCWKNKLKTLETFNKCKSLALGNCSQITYERDQSERVIKYHEVFSPQMVLLVALDSCTDQGLRYKRQ